jgi:predicted Rossmann fold nucleotide-binding protein DprA/Smf involved in DNA uptake
VPNVSVSVTTDASMTLDASPVANLATEGLLVLQRRPPAKPSAGWALALTEGLGPSRTRKLVEHFGSADRILQASLTELEASGMRAVSAQALATGRSLGLAQDEVARAMRASATITDQAGREAGSNVGGRMGRASRGGAGGALSAGPNESPAPANASLFPDDVQSPHEQKPLKLLKPDESTHIDELVEMLENEMSSLEIFCALFCALFELELSGKVRQLPGKNFV